MSQSHNLAIGLVLARLGQALVLRLAARGQSLLQIPRSFRPFFAPHLNKPRTCSGEREDFLLSGEHGAISNNVS